MAFFAFKTFRLLFLDIHGRLVHQNVTGVVVTLPRLPLGAARSALAPACSTSAHPSSPDPRCRRARRIKISLRWWRGRKRCTDLFHKVVLAAVRVVGFSFLKALNIAFTLWSRSQRRISGDRLSRLPRVFGCARHRPSFDYAQRTPRRALSCAGNTTVRDPALSVSDRMTRLCRRASRRSNDFSEKPRRFEQGAKGGWILLCRTNIPTIRPRSSAATLTSRIPTRRVRKTRL
jgi:hypothetical protein